MGKRGRGGTETKRCGRAVRALMVRGICASGVSGLFAMQPSAFGAKVAWVQAGLLGRGKVGEYTWSAGAKLPKEAPLGNICGELSMTAPPVEGIAEGQSSTECGELATAGDVVTANASFGSGASQAAVTELLYRPIVRGIKVWSVGGKIRFLHTHAPRIPNRPQQGIAAFRFILLPASGRDCVRRVIAVSRGGRVVSRQASRAVRADPLFSPTECDFYGESSLPGSRSYVWRTFRHGVSCSRI